MKGVIDVSCCIIAKVMKYVLAPSRPLLITQSRIHVIFYCIQFNSNWLHLLRQTNHEHMDNRKCWKGRYSHSKDRW